MEKKNVSILIKNADWCVTVDPTRRVITNCTIAIDGNKIVKIGKDSEFENYTADTVISGKGKLVTPGFIDCHTHAHGGAFRGLGRQQVGCYMWGERFLGRSFFDLYSNPDIVYLSSVMQIIHRLKRGTTCIADAAITPLCPEYVVKAYEATGGRGVLGRKMLDVFNWPDQYGPEFREPTEVTLEKTEAFIQANNNAQNGRVKVWPMPDHPAVSCSDKLLLGSKELADKYDVGLHMHTNVDEMAIWFSKIRWGEADVARLNSLGILDKRCMLVHMAQLDDNDLDILEKTHASVIHCPSSSNTYMYGAIRNGRWPEMLKRGINIGIGSDSNMNVAEIPANLYTTMAEHEEYLRTVDTITQQQAMEMGTLNGAKALLLDQQIGSLEVGKKADIAIFDTTDIEWYPLHKYNLLHNLFYFAQGHACETVLVDGQILVQDGKLTKVDERMFIDEFQKLGERIVGTAEEYGYYGHPWLPTSTWAVE